MLRLRKSFFLLIIAPEKPSGDVRSLASSKVGHGARRDRPSTPLANFSVDENIKVRPLSDEMKVSWDY